MAQFAVYSRAAVLRVRFTKEDYAQDRHVTLAIDRAVLSGHMSAFVVEELSESVEKYLLCLGYELTTQKWDATAGRDGNGAWVDIGGTNISWEAKEGGE